MSPSWLRRHPFAVEAFFDRSIVLTYSFPEARLRGYLPECLSLDTFEGEHAFVAVAVVQTRGLRPKGLPSFLGRDFLLIGYRIFVRYVNRAGRRMRGLYILRSETDSRSMKALGNLLTRYRYVRIGVTLEDEGDLTTVRCDAPRISIAVDRNEAAGPSLPPGSPFSDSKDARRFAGPLPFTFSVEPQARRVVIIEGVRANWEPRLVRVLEQSVPFVDALGEGAGVLASAFMVEDIPYWWKKGVVEECSP